MDSITAFERLGGVLTPMLPVLGAVLIAWINRKVQKAGEKPAGSSSETQAATITALSAHITYLVQENQRLQDALHVLQYELQECRRRYGMMALDVGKDTD
jgi:cell division protein FtsB